MIGKREPRGHVDQPRRQVDRAGHVGDTGVADHAQIAGLDAAVGHLEIAAEIGVAGLPPGKPRGDRVGEPLDAV